MQVFGPILVRSKVKTNAISDYFRPSIENCFICRLIRLFQLKTQAKEPKRRSQTIAVDMTELHQQTAHNYSIQTLNSTELAKEKLRNVLEKVFYLVEVSRFSLSKRFLKWNFFVRIFLKRSFFNRTFCQSSPYTSYFIIPSSPHISDFKFDTSHFSIHISEFALHTWNQFSIYSV